MPLLPKVARACLHFWEEPSISGEKGSGTVFFSGCTLSCVYCQNYEISHLKKGKTVSYEELAQIFRDLESQGANNINLVTPTHYAVSIKKALEIYKPKIPVIYNSSGFERVDTLKMLEGLVDIYLLDLKYLNKEKAYKYSNAKEYPSYAKACITEALRQQPFCIFKDKIMQKGVIIRHLLLPQSTREAMAVFDWVKENAKGAYFSIMSQYTPCGQLKSYPEIARKVTKREYEKVLNYICQTDFSNVYIQDISSADKMYIPDFIK